MTTHQCPKCELRFERKTELDDHCWHDHPEFRHEYPAVAPPEPPAAPAVAHPSTHEPVHMREGFLRWLVPRQRSDDKR